MVASTLCASGGISMQNRKGLLYALSALAVAGALVLFGLLFSCMPSNSRSALIANHGPSPTFDGWRPIGPAFMVTPIGDYEWSRRLQNPTTSAVVGVIELPESNETIHQHAQVWCQRRAVGGWRAILQMTADRAMCMAELVPKSLFADRAALSEVEKVVFVSIPQTDGRRVRYAVLGRSSGTTEQGFDVMAKAVEFVLASLYGRITA